MKFKKLIILLSIIFISLSWAHSQYHFVTSVYDGDTILIDTGEKVRYLGIDAPEIDLEGGKDEYMALESKAFNIRLVNRKKVSLEFDREKKDRYGRLLAYVYMDNGVMVNALIVRRGLAHVLLKRPNLQYLELLIESQRLAMTEKIGIWRKEPSRVEKYYLGNKNSHRFHRPGCPFGRKIRSHNLLMFQTRREAFWEGFSPCKRCRP